MYLIHVLGPWVAKTSRGMVLAGVTIRGVCAKTPPGNIPLIMVGVRLSNPDILDWIYSTTGK